MNASEASFFIDIAPIPVTALSSIKKENAVHQHSRSASAERWPVFLIGDSNPPRLILQQMLPFYAVLR
jgi:hypothetical protein